VWDGMQWRRGWGQRVDPPVVGGNTEDPWQINPKPSKHHEEYSNSETSDDDMEAPPMNTDRRIACQKHMIDQGDG